MGNPVSRRLPLGGGARDRKHRTTRGTPAGAGRTSMDGERPQHFLMPGSSPIAYCPVECTKRLAPEGCPVALTPIDVGDLYVLLPLAAGDETCQDQHPRLTSTNSAARIRNGRLVQMRRHGGTEIIDHRGWANRAARPVALATSCALTTEPPPCQGGHRSQQTYDTVCVVPTVQQPPPPPRSFPLKRKAEPAEAPRTMTTNASDVGGDTQVTNSHTTLDNASSGAIRPQQPMMSRPDLLEVIPCPAP